MRAALAGSLLLVVGEATAVRGGVLWSHPESMFVSDNDTGVEILHGALKPRDTNSAGTLYFRFRLDPISDSATKSLGDFRAGFMFVEKGREHLGIGNTFEAWAYCALNATNNRGKPYVDFNSALAEPGKSWEYMRAGVPRVFVFKIEFVPGHEARVTVWLNPDLARGATELSQPTNIITRFEANATFDEIRLVHRGKQGGWKFSQMAAATSFEDFIDLRFWQRGWFLGGSMGVLLLAVGGGVRLSERKRAQRRIQLLERERAVADERARIAQDIHDEVGASLTKISKLAEWIEHDAGAGHSNGELTRSIAKTARDTIQAMDEIVWAINPKNDTLKEMADYLVYFAGDFLRPTGIACGLNVPLRLPALQVPAELRHNLFLVVKEALNNAVKHASPKRITLKLELVSESRLRIEVADDGKGFELAPAEGAGNGMGNMRKRIEAVGGVFHLQSQPGEGTLVAMEVSLGKRGGAL
jgi:signal transduction histidine kinase